MVIISNVSVSDLSSSNELQNTYSYVIFKLDGIISRTNVIENNLDFDSDNEDEIEIEFNEIN